MFIAEILLLMYNKTDIWLADTGLVCFKSM